MHTHCARTDRAPHAACASCASHAAHTTHSSKQCAETLTRGPERSCQPLQSCGRTTAACWRLTAQTQPLTHHAGATCSVASGHAAQRSLPLPPLLSVDTQQHQGLVAGGLGSVLGACGKRKRSGAMEDAWRHQHWQTRDGGCGAIEQHPLCPDVARTPFRRHFTCMCPVYMLCYRTTHLPGLTQVVVLFKCSILAKCRELVSHEFALAGRVVRL